ncbi:MAG: DUF4129 domain-containing protein [Deltaproteobacteria bacterium]|nr:DUF4129 domain-containing protein [Deltaproteobacteria bacterium]
MNPLTTRLWLAAPLLVAAGLFTVVSLSRPVGLASGALVLGAAALGPRIALRPSLQQVFSAAVAVLTGALLTNVLGKVQPGVGRIDAIWTILAASALATGASRLVLRQALWGSGAVATLGTVAVVASAQVLRPWVFLPAALLTLASVLASMRVERGLAPLWGPPTSRRRALATGVILVGALGGLAGGAVALPRLHGKVLSTLTRQAFDETARSGVPEDMHLGDLEGLTLSTRVVWRARGPVADHLRGPVLNHYRRGRWVHRGLDTLGPVQVLRGEPRGCRAPVELQRAEELSRRLFAPMHSGRLGVTNGRVVVDAEGSFAWTAPEAPATVWFCPGPRTTGAISAPTNQDLQVPRTLQPGLAAVLQQWGVDPTTQGPAERVSRIRSRLVRFRYTTRVRRGGRGDPTLEFLTVTHAGYCEYFASAVALLARQAGLPSRVVLGYRVSEHNPLGGWRVVMERNAHAWAEVWYPTGGWVTVDATPAADESQGHRMSFTEAVSDALSAAWSRFWWRVKGWHLALAVGVVTLLGLGLWRLRRVPGEPEELPPPGLRALLEALAQRGLARAPSETLESLAERVEAARDLPFAVAVAAQLRARSAQRFGGVGDADAVEAAMEALAGGLR